MGGDLHSMNSGRETLRLRAEVDEDIAKAAEIVRGGGTVAFPTETVYGLGANALHREAVAKIFVAKERPTWDPLIVHVSDREMLGRVARMEGEAGARAERLMEAFWPGALTMLLPRTEAVPDAVTAGRERVGVRMPRHVVAMELIRRAGVPVAAPSANRFGRTSPTTAAHVLADLDGRVDAVLDGGATEVGVESTVLDVCEWPMVIYRPGAVTAEMIAEVAGEVRMFRAGAVELEGARPEGLPSPGVGLRHYAPRARLVLVRDADGSLPVEGARCGVMLPDGWAAAGAAYVFRWGRWDAPEVLARRMFDGLRTLDGMGAEVIVCPLPGAGGMGDALRDRLEKAARPGSAKI